MKWRYVFDGHAKYWSSREEVIKIAFFAGYRFIAWNGKVYFIVDENNYHDTGISDQELE